MAIFTSRRVSYNIISLMLLILIIAVLLAPLFISTKDLADTCPHKSSKQYLIKLGTRIDDNCVSHDNCSSPYCPPTFCIAAVPLYILTLVTGLKNLSNKKVTIKILISLYVFYIFKPPRNIYTCIN